MTNRAQCRDIGTNIYTNNIHYCHCYYYVAQEYGYSSNNSNYSGYICI